NTGTFNISGNANIVRTGTTSVAFNNIGTLTRTGDATLTQIGVPFDNTGTVQINGSNAILNIFGGGSSSGSFNVAQGASLDFAGPYNLNTGTSIVGPGNVNVSVSGVTIGNGVDQLTGEFSITSGATLNATGSLIELPSGKTLNPAVTPLRVSNATINGNGS